MQQNRKRTLSYFDSQVDFLNIVFLYFCPSAILLLNWLAYGTAHDTVFIMTLLIVIWRQFLWKVLSRNILPETALSWIFFVRGEYILLIDIVQEHSNNYFKMKLLQMYHQSSYTTVAFRFLGSFCFLGFSSTFG